MINQTDSSIRKTNELPLLTVDSISKRFGDDNRSVNALASVSFGVQPGEFVCLLGPSGSGKSTLLRIIGGLLQADSGAVHLAGEMLTGPHRDVGFVFQKTNLMPWRSVLQNVLLPIEVRQGHTDGADEEMACGLLKLVGLDGFADALPKQLSGGMSQRVVLARSLIQQPKLLLMDEPFGALDSLTRERLNIELLRIQQVQASTILMVTHSISEAAFLADRVLLLTDRPGQIRAQVIVDLPRPRTLEIMGSEQFGQLTMAIREQIGSTERV